MKILEGKKVMLRPIEMDDTKLIVKWRNTQIVRESFLFRETFTEEMHNLWMRTRVQSGEVVQFIILDKATCKPVGSVYFRDIDAQRHTAEFGIFIGEADTLGKGLGSETTKLFTDFGFSDLGLKQIRLRVLCTNLCAISTYRDTGFVQESPAQSAVCSDGSCVDVVIMTKRMENEE